MGMIYNVIWHSLCNVYIELKFFSPWRSSTITSRGPSDEWVGLLINCDEVKKLSDELGMVMFVSTYTNHTNISWPKNLATRRNIVGMHMTARLCFVDFPFIEYLLSRLSSRGFVKVNEVIQLISLKEWRNNQYIWYSTRSARKTR